MNGSKVQGLYRPPGLYSLLRAKSVEELGLTFLRHGRGRLGEEGCANGPSFYALLPLPEVTLLLHTAARREDQRWVRTAAPSEAAMHAAFGAGGLGAVFFAPAPAARCREAEGTTMESATACRRLAEEPPPPTAPPTPPAQTSSSLRPRPPRSTRRRGRCS